MVIIAKRAIVGVLNSASFAEFNMGHINRYLLYIDLSWQPGP
jgi:hypothetical protein